MNASITMRRRRQVTLFVLETCSLAEARFLFISSTFFVTSASSSLAFSCRDLRLASLIRSKSSSYSSLASRNKRRYIHCHHHTHHPLQNRNNDSFHYHHHSLHDKELYYHHDYHQLPRPHPTLLSQPQSTQHTTCSTTTTTICTRVLQKNFLLALKYAPFPWCDERQEVVK